MKKETKNIRMFLYQKKLEEIKKVTNLSMSSVEKTKFVNNFLNTIVNSLKEIKGLKQLVVLNINTVSEDCSIFEALSLVTKQIVLEYEKIIPKDVKPTWEHLK